MKDFFKYLTVSEQDKQWGLHLTVAGRARIAPHAAYPSIEHPTGYFFTWAKGRVLQEFQLNYISEGSGVLESASTAYEIKAGTLIITRPGTWHRYRPDAEVGWVENYIGIDGPVAEDFLTKSIFANEQSVIHSGIHEEIIDTYHRIYELVRHEEPGFQQIASGMVIKLLGQAVAFTRRQNFSGRPIEEVIRKVQVQMRENIAGDFDLQQFAQSHHMAYSYLRKMFKRYTGIAPHQYYLDLKLMRAKEMLLTTDKSIKEIGFELGFESIHYFSRWFKKRMEINPSDLRKTVS